jgi:conjugative transfer region protein (TIGR03748 family)
MKLAVPLLAGAALLAGCATAPRVPPPTVAAVAPPAMPVQPVQAPSRLMPPATKPSAAGLQVARYTTLAPMPSEADADPLAVVVKVHFPRQAVQTVGDAVRHLLLRTGFQLADADRLDERARAVLAMRLPDSQRVLGPYRVETMLGVLLGRPFRVVADAATRTVSYVAAVPGAPSQDAGAPAPRAATQHGNAAAIAGAAAPLQARGAR